MSEFHQFESLPTEIRLKVWRYALQPINPTRRRAHFFSVTNYGEDGDALTKLRVQCFLGSDCKTGHGSYFCLAAPKFGTSHSWINNNPSAYLWDFGMWSACCESNAVIEKHYNLDYWKARLRRSRSRMHVGEPAEPCVPFIHTRTGGNWCFPIYPNLDLVCLQTFDIDRVDLYWGYEYLMKGFCMVEEDRGLRGFVNLALEYDSSWFDGSLENITLTHLLGEKSPRGLFIRTLCSMDDKDLAYTPETLWLVDYKLKRDNYKSDRVTSSEDQVFHGSNKIFVRVLNTREYLDTYKNSALDFLDNVRKLLDLYGPHYDSCLCHTGTYNHNGCMGCYFGLTIMKYHLQVLACEDVE